MGMLDNEVNLGSCKVTITPDISPLKEALELLCEVYRQAGNEAGTVKRHALTPGLRDNIRDFLKSFSLLPVVNYPSDAKVPTQDHSH